MRVVSNTSPVSNLAIVGRLEVLRAKYGAVVVPEAVRRELSRLAHPAGAAAVRQAFAEGWLVMEAVADRTVIPVLRARVDEGEAEAIELARQTRADLLLMDDSAGRAIAREEGLPFTGLVGVLAEEREAGRIASLKAELDMLRRECGFFLSAELESRVLRRVGEAE
jgi:predicted nucleic acid-binding protein